MTVPPREGPRDEPGARRDGVADADVMAEVEASLAEMTIRLGRGD